MKRVFIDFDGVILNTQYDLERIKITEYADLTWEDFSSKFDWDSFYHNADVINDSIIMFLLLLKQIQLKNKKLNFVF